MPRLIDADALLDYFRNEHHESEVIEAVKDAPTIDAVPVVRCKDCKWCRYSKVHDVQWCDHESGLCDAIVGNEFCSYGERKDNDG